MKLGGTVEQPFFNVKGRMLHLLDEDIQSFEFPNPTAALASAKNIRTDGSGSDTTVAMWIAPPHFYRKGRIIVLYLGRNKILIGYLAKVLGPQFAGQ